MSDKLVCAECGKRLSQYGSILKGNYPVYGRWDRLPRHEACNAHHSRDMAYSRGVHVVGQLMQMYGPRSYQS